MRQRVVLVASIALALTLAISGCGGDSSGDAVVKVGDTAITKATFDHWISVEAASSKTSANAKVIMPDPPNYTACITNLRVITPKPVNGHALPTATALKNQCEQQYKSLQNQTLSFLIALQWAIGEAQSLGIKLSDSELNSYFAEITSQQFPKAREFEKFLSRSGQTTSDYMLRVKFHLLYMKTQQKIAQVKGAVTQAQMEKFYNEHKAAYRTEERRDVQSILVKTQAQAKKAKQEIESGKSFSSVAKRVSINAIEKANGGLFKQQTEASFLETQATKALGEQIFSTNRNVLTGPVKTPLGYYIFRVLSVTPAQQSSLVQVQSSIKQILAEQNERHAVTNFKLKWKAKTDCQAGYVIEDCKQYIAPKTPPPLAGTQQRGVATPQRAPQTATPKVANPPTAGNIALAPHARILSVRETAHLRLTSNQSSILNEQGTTTGTIVGTIVMHLRLVSSSRVVAEVSIYPRGSSLWGAGAASYQVHGAMTTLSGTLAIARGTGSYSRARGNALRFTGVMRQRNRSLTVELSGKLSV